MAAVSLTPASECMNSNPAIVDEIRRYEEQYSRNPESLVFARLADAYRKSGEVERALAVLEEGLARHADYLSGHIVRARAYADLGRRVEAVDAFESVLRLDAANVVALRALADLALEEGDRGSACRWLVRLVQVDPLHEEARRQLEALSAGPDEPPATPADLQAPGSAPGRVETASRDAGSESLEEVPGRPLEAHPDAPSGGAPTPGPASSGAGEATEGRGGGPELAWWKEVVEGLPSASDGEGSPWRDLWGSEAEPPPVEEGEDADLLTRTMAELYARQGLNEEAVEIYEELLRENPGDADVARLLEQARARTRGAPRPATPSTSWAEVPREDHPPPRAEAPPEEPAGSGATAVSPTSCGTTRGALPVGGSQEPAATPPDRGVGPPPPAGRSGTSVFFLEWLRGLRR